MFGAVDDGVGAVADRQNDIAPHDSDFGLARHGQKRFQKIGATETHMTDRACIADSIATKDRHLDGTLPFSHIDGIIGYGFHFAIDSVITEKGGKGILRKVIPDNACGERVRCVRENISQNILSSSFRVAGRGAEQ